MRDFDKIKWGLWFLFGEFVLLRGGMKCLATSVKKIDEQIKYDSNKIKIRKDLAFDRTVQFDGNLFFSSQKKEGNLPTLHTLPMPYNPILKTKDLSNSAFF